MGTGEKFGRTAAEWDEIVQGATILRNTRVGPAEIPTL